MTDDNSCVALYSTHVQTETAMRALQNAAFDVKNISIIGKGCHEKDHPVGLYNIDERTSLWGMQSEFWTGVWSLLFGTALFWIPGLGSVVMAGPVVAVLVSALEGAMTVSGVSVIGAALYGIGIPRDSIVLYETALKSNHYLLILHGAQKEVERAHEVLVASEPSDVAIHLS